MCVVSIKSTKHASNVVIFELAIALDRTPNNKNPRKILSILLREL